MASNKSLKDENGPSASLSAPETGAPNEESADNLVKKDSSKGEQVGEIPSAKSIISKKSTVGKNDEKHENESHHVRPRPSHVQTVRMTSQQMSQIPVSALQAISRGGSIRVPDILVTENSENRHSSNPRVSISPSLPKNRRSSAWESDNNYDERDDDDEVYPLDEELAQYDHTFDQLQGIFDETITGLESSNFHGVNMDPVKSLFGKLWDGIKLSHHNVMRLQQRDHDTSVELSTVMAKTKTLIKLAEEDPTLAGKLRSKLESAWGLADVCEADEIKNSTKIAELKEDIFMLNNNIAAAAKTEGHDTVLELKKIKSQYEAQKNIVAGEAAKLHSDLKLIFERRASLNEMRLNLEEKLKMLSEEELVHQEAIARENGRKDRLKKSIKHTISQTEERTAELNQLIVDLGTSEQRYSEIDQEVRDQRLVNEETQHDLEMCNNKYVKLKQDYETQAKLCERLTADFYKRQADLKEKEDDVGVTKGMITRMNRQKTANLKKVEEYKSIIRTLELERDSLKEKQSGLEKELEAAQKKQEEFKKQVEELERERALANRTLQKAEAIMNSHEAQVLTHEIAVANMETEIAGYHLEIKGQETIIATLEKEKESYTNDAKKLAHQVVVRLEEVKKLDRAIYDYHRRLGRIETQLKKQQQIYENAVYDKTVAERQLRDGLTEVNENSVKLIHLGHKILTLKFQLSEKGRTIQTESTRYERVLRETTFYAGEGKRLKHLAYDVQRMVEALESERFLLKKTVAAIQGEMSKQSFYANTAESRKNVFQRKLMSKEHEVKEIWEKSRVLHSMIRIGAYHFRNVITDIRKIRVQIFETKRDNLVKSNGNNTAKKLEHEISVLENIISKEMSMCNSLRESMRHPINVHRWRVLECTNPDAFDMVQKVNLLTKRLVERNALLSTQEKDLVFKQEIYTQIRGALLKAPGLELPENVTYYEHLEASKKRQHEALIFELHAAESQTEYYEDEIGKIGKKCENLKKEYFAQMKALGRGLSAEFDENDEVPEFTHEERESVVMLDTKDSVLGIVSVFNRNSVIERAEKLYL